jgi:CBS domain containing-hemolysin-like protein
MICSGIGLADSAAAAWAPFQRWQQWLVTPSLPFTKRIACALVGFQHRERGNAAQPLSPAI